MTEDLEDTVSTLKLSRELEEDYIMNLELAMNALVKKMTELRTFNSNIVEYFQTFSDIISVYGIEETDRNFANILVSNNSGLPTYSRIHAVKLSQNKSKATLNKARKEKEIIPELINGIYKNKKRMAQSRLRELKKRQHTEKLLNIKRFDHVLERRLKETFTKTNINQYIIEYADFDITSTSCIAVTATYSSLDDDSKPSKERLKKYANNDVDWIYNGVQEKKVLPVLIRKAQTHFYFNEKKQDDIAIAKFLKANPKEYVLKLNLTSIEDLNLMLATTKKELETELDSPQREANKIRYQQAIYVCHEDKEEEFSDILTRTTSDQTLTTYKEE